MAKKRRVVEVNLQVLDGIVDAARTRTLSEEEGVTLKTALHDMAQGLMPSLKSEKFNKLLERHRPQPPKEEADKPKAPGHGRNGAAAFTGATRVPVPHATLQPGCPCQHCPKGKVYPARNGPAPLIRVTGHAPFQATIYELEKLRCNLCGEIYEATAPDGVGPDKHDETVASMIGILKYGKGVPFNRIEGLQKQVGVPLPASTQWDLVEEAAELLKPVYQELVQTAAQADLEYSDDTRARIIEVHREPDEERTGVFTTAIVAQLDRDRKIALFLSGKQHAGENMADLLAQRSAHLGPVMLMCDALNHNVPKVSEDVEMLVANCLAHGRRQFVDVLDAFPDQCLYVLEQIGKVYRFDEQARDQNLDPRQRLVYHQANSKPVMSDLYKWMQDELDGKRVEPNSRLGKAMKYLINHWKELTLFLRHPGAPLDNNVCERAIKKAVLHRKNALFYRSLDGAYVGDLFMSLIHTCELNEVKPFDFLNALQRNAVAVRAAPSKWMPWNYESTAATAT